MNNLIGGITMHNETAADMNISLAPNFTRAQDMGERPWGAEELLSLIDGKLMLKRLLIKAGNKGGLQYHRFKDECGILLSGKMIIRYLEGGELTEKLIESGDCFHFPPGCVHQEEAVEDCVIIEGSTTVFNDRVRVEEEFGLGDPEGMQTSNISEVEFR